MIDLDEMRWGYRIFDVAFGVATVAGLDQGPDGSIVRSTWELKRAEAFLSGWSRHTQPTEVEIRVFPWMLLLTLARVVIGYWHRCQICRAFLGRPVNVALRLHGSDTV